MSDLFIRSRYNLGDPCPGITFTQPTLTQQHFQEECDVNNIMKKYLVTGTVPQIAGAFYDETPDVVDYFSLNNHIAGIDEAFMELPSAVRKKFQNNPGLLLEFLSDERNLDEAISLGLISKQDAYASALQDVSPKENQEVSEKPSDLTAGEPLAR